MLNNAQCVIGNAVLNYSQCIIGNAVLSNVQ